MFAVITIIAITILSLGCITNDENVTGNETTGKVSPVTTIYSENDSRGTAYALTGDTIIVKLTENPTTGYSWNMTYSEGLELKEDSYMDKNDTGGLVGAAGLHQWIFEVTDAGEQNVSAVYMRPWEEKTGDKDIFSLNVMVLTEDELIKSSGTVTYIGLEGGFYGIITSDDTHYDPINLAEELRNDGTEIEFVAYPRDDLMSFHMWGQLIEIRTVIEVGE